MIPVTKTAGRLSNLWSDMIINERVARMQRRARPDVEPDMIALWRTLLGLDLMDTVTVHAPPGHPLPYLLTDARLVRVTGSEDGLWFRMLDAPAVLEARSYGAELSVVLEVSDGVLGAGGRYALDIRDGRARCERSEAEPDVHTDLSVLGSLYLGAHRASAFAAANRLRCNDSTVIAKLDAAFASEVPAQLGYGF